MHRVRRYFVAVSAVVALLAGACGGDDIPDGGTIDRRPMPAVQPKPGWTQDDITQARLALSLAAKGGPNGLAQMNYVECLLMWITNNTTADKIGVRGVHPDIVSVGAERGCRAIAGYKADDDS